MRTCAFCFNASASAADSTFDPATYGALVRQMARLRSAPETPRRLNLTGGEPLLEPRLAELAQLATDHGVPVAVTTAGLPIPAARMRRLAEAKADVTLSFDCSDRETYERTRGKGTFRPAVESLEALSSSGCLRRAILVITRETKPWMEETVLFLAGFGVREFVLMEQSLPPETFDERGVRLERSGVLALQRLEPRARFVLGHQCPVTLNVSPDGRYFIQNPPAEIQMLGGVNQVGLTRALDRLGEVAGRCATEPSEIFEPLCASAAESGR